MSIRHAMGTSRKGCGAYTNSSHTQSGIDRRRRELIEYMSWRSGWETLQAYQHYFDPQGHAEMQDRL